MAHPLVPEIPVEDGALGAPMAPADLPLAAVHRPTTYRELLGDETLSPTRDRLANYFQGYRYEGGVLPVPTVLREQTVVISDRQPMTFLCLVAGHNGFPEIAIMHRMMRYMDMPGEDASGFHDRYLGLLGDIMPHQYPTVEIPSTVFHLVGTPVRVPTTGAMMVHIEAWADPSVPLGPYNEDDPETEVVRPRNTQLIPGYYAAILIHRRGVSAKTAYQDLYGAMQARGEVDRCRDVITWLKAACTARGGGGLQNGVPVVYHPLAPVHLPMAVYRYATEKVRGDLPALADEATAGGTMASTLAGALRALTRASGGSGAGADDRAGGGREPKPVQEVYRETYGTLMRYCNVTRPEDVAPVWRRLANCAKSEQQTILNQEFQRVCLERKLSTEIYAPAIVTTALKQMIVSFQFVGYGVNDLGTGGQPFQVTYSGGVNHMEALDTASIGNQLAQGEHNATLADIRTIREKEKVKFPVDISQTCITLYRYAVLCQALFQGEGMENPFVASMWKLANAMQNGAPFVADSFQQHVARFPAVANVYYPTIVRAVQVITYEYLQHVGINEVVGHEGVELPDWRAVVADLRRGTFHNTSNWVPIPEEYLAQPRGNTGSRTTAAGTLSTAGSTGASVRTGVSSLTTDTPRTVMARIENPQPDAEFTGIMVRPGGFRPILQNRPPPSNDAGLKFCAAWWLRGACFPNCRRRATHVPFASAGERTRLLTFCRDHLAAPASGGT